MVTHTYRMESEIPPVKPLKLKVEINSREHFTVLDVHHAPYPLILLGSEARLNRTVPSALDLQPGQQVLDVGCGTGTLTRMIALA